MEEVVGGIRALDASVATTRLHKHDSINAENDPHTTHDRNKQKRNEAQLFPFTNIFTIKISITTTIAVFS